MAKKKEREHVTISVFPKKTQRLKKKDASPLANFIDDYGPMSNFIRLLKKLTSDDDTVKKLKRNDGGMAMSTRNKQKARIF